MSYYRGGGGRGRGGGGRGDYYKNKYGNGGRGNRGYGREDSGGSFDNNNYARDNRDNGYGNNSGSGSSRGGGGYGRDNNSPRNGGFGHGGRDDGRSFGGGPGSGGRGGWGSSPSSSPKTPVGGQPMYGDFNNPASGGGTYFDLEKILTRIDGKPYGAYHDLDTPYPRGWVNKTMKFTLFIEKAQSDPFAPPTRCRIEVDSRKARIPVSMTSSKIRRIAVADFLFRTMYENCKRLGLDSALSSSGWSGPKGGDIQIAEPSQHVLEQSAVQITNSGQVIAQIAINLPARGRNILGEAAWTIFNQKLRDVIESSLIFDSLDAEMLEHHMKSVEDQVWLQDELDHRNLVAFVPNGAILPRVSGVDDRPLQTSPIRFKSPDEMEVSFQLPNAGTELSGMGIPKGVTVICGGGFHGKSTLLTALEFGVYPKIPGDGREFCVASPRAAKIRAEDGRAVEAVDISTFIQDLPFGKDTTCFSTSDASGSTSQVANIIESVEIGADLLLLDEDTCATNFMIRDDKMMQLVTNDPITPFIQVVRSMFQDFGISSVLVIGGAGDYFEVADNVIMMDCYQCHDVTEKAKRIVESSVSSSLFPEAPTHQVSFRASQKRYPRASAFSARGKSKVLSKKSIIYADTELDLSGLEQIVTKSQSRTILNALQNMPLFAAGGSMTLKEALEALEQKMDEDGLDVLCPNQFDGEMARPRLLEIAGAANRLRRDNRIRQKS